MSVIENIRNNGLKYITPHRVFVYLRSFFRKVKGYRIKETDAIAFSEIITYKTLTCPDCVQLGKCRVCHCPINELFTAMDVGCSDGKFPAFQETRSWYHIWQEIKKFKFKSAIELFKVKHWRDGWKQYKEENNIFFTIFWG